jgi:molecular chaperone GrpE
MSDNFKESKENVDKEYLNKEEEHIQEEDSTDTPSGEDLQTKLEAAEKRIRELEEENALLKDQYLRKVADFDNYRKRMAKEKQETILFANKQLLLDLIHVLDDLERAIKSAESSKNFDAFHEGILMIEKRLSELLEQKWGLKRLESVGETFDPSKHEALLTEERPDHEVPMVLEDYQKAYSLHDKIIRTAKVKVSLPKGKDTSNINNEQNTMAGT